MSDYDYFPALETDEQRRARYKLIKSVEKQEQRNEVLTHLKMKEMAQFGELDDITRHEVEQISKDDQILAALYTIAEKTSELLTDFRLANTRRGKVYGNRFTVSATTGPVLIDLKTPDRALNTLLGINLYVPRVPIPEMILINEGPGTLQFGINEDAGDTRTLNTLPPPAAGTNPVPFPLRFGQPVVERVCFVASSSNLTLNMFLII